LAIGIAVGAGVALLIAPQSGEDTRHAIARRGRKLTRRGRDAWDDLRDELRAARRRRRRAKAERADKERASEVP
jgi:gas vesicle protein